MCGGYPINVIDNLVLVGELFICPEVCESVRMSQTLQTVTSIRG